MKIIKKMSEKAADNMNNEGVTIAFLGDSITQGCFEIYKCKNNGIDTVYDKNSAYHNYLAQIFTILFPTVPVNIINAGISGDTAPGGLKRIDRDVISHKPDLTVVCYGLNDCSEDTNSLGKYTNALNGIFEKLQKTNTEIIFMTPNMMNTKVSVHISDDEFIASVAENSARLQTQGTFDRHIDAARELCRKCNITICDCYNIWKKLYNSGVDCTELLANKINHPSRNMNKLFAIELVRTMFSCEE